MCHPTVPGSAEPGGPPLLIGACLWTESTRSARASWVRDQTEKIFETGTTESVDIKGSPVILLDDARREERQAAQGAR